MLFVGGRPPHAPWLAVTLTTAPAPRGMSLSTMNSQLPVPDRNTVWGNVVEPGGRITLCCAPEIGTRSQLKGKMWLKVKLNEEVLVLLVDDVEAVLVEDERDEEAEVEEVEDAEAMLLRLVRAPSVAAGRMPIPLLLPYVAGGYTLLVMRLYRTGIHGLRLVGERPRQQVQP